MLIFRTPCVHDISLQICSKTDLSCKKSCDYRANRTRSRSCFRHVLQASYQILQKYLRFVKHGGRAKYCLHLTRLNRSLLFFRSMSLYFFNLAINKSLFFLSLLLSLLDLDTRGVTHDKGEHNRTCANCQRRAALRLLRRSNSALWRFQKNSAILMYVRLKRR